VERVVERPLPEEGDTSDPELDPELAQDPARQNRIPVSPRWRRSPYRR
jgi:hypothetical protein